MITFKEFIELQEAVVKPWPVRKVKDVAVIRAIKFLEQKTHFFEALNNDGLIYRGFQDYTAFNGSTLTVIDSSKGARTSRDSDNMYQLMMDTSLSMKEVPSRTKSFICSTSMDTINEHSRSKHGHMVMVPIGNVEVAHIIQPDLFSLIFSGEFGDIDPDSNLISRFLKALKVGLESPYTDAHLIDDALSPMNFTANELAVVWAANARSGSDEFSELSFTDPGADRIYKTVPGSWTLDAIKQLGEELENDNTRHVPNLVKQVRMFFKQNKQSIFSALSDMYVTPKALNLEMIKYGKENRTGNNECWFSGRAVVIPFDFFAKILYQILVRDHAEHANSVHPDIRTAWNSAIDKVHFDETPDFDSLPKSKDEPW